MIPGKEAVTRISYNRAGQPIQMTETGYAPVLPNSIQRVAANGTSPESNSPPATKLAQPNAAIPLERTTHYRYSTVNGRSVLTEIDGPLKNGPNNTQIKRYDEVNQLIAQTDDKGESERYGYDLAGHRIRAIFIAKDGKVKNQIAWRYAQNRLIEIADAAQTERIRYNERGQPATRTITLRLNSGAYTTHTTRYNYDADGGLESQSLPDGSTLVFERNGQGQVVAVSRQTSPWATFGLSSAVLVKNLERDLIGLRSITYGNGIQGQWQRSRQGLLARIVYTRNTRFGSSGVKLASNDLAQVSWSAAARAVLEAFVPAAHAQNLPPKQNNLPGALGLPVGANALFDARLLYSPSGDVILQQQAQGAQRTQAYAYDARHQLIAAQTSSQSMQALKTSASKQQLDADARIWRYAYDGNGNRILAQEEVPIQEMGQTRKASYNPNSNALVTQPDLSREYVWDAQGRLIAIRQENRDLAHYRYNYRGLRVSKQIGNTNEYTLYNDQRQRIANLDGQGRITRQYIWLADQLIATLDAIQPKTLQAPPEGFWQQLIQTAQALWTRVTGNEDRIAYIHVNHLGAPIAATDVQGKILWQADYAPYGKLIKVSAGHQERGDGGRTGYTLALRYPGQWEGAESGLYYNDQRYYDPNSGRYLSPDPLGKTAEALGSTNPYAYVNNNPLSYIDPWGLILFAFDGTGNDETIAATLSNVVKFRDLYQDGQPFYITGPGTTDPATGIGPSPADIGGIGDIARAYTGPARIAAMVEYLDKYSNSVEDETAFDVDITGFSRGAAEAREFANRVAAKTKNGWYSYKDKSGVAKCQKLNFRFMGLFDTVLSTHTGSYKLGIPDGFQYVAHAIALNEYRGGAVAFPLESITGVPIPQGTTRIEQGFLGSHSDIGGGFPDGDLQGRTGVDGRPSDGGRSEHANINRFGSKRHRQSRITRQSSNLLFGAPSGGPTPTSEDRTVRYADGTTVKQRQATTFGMTYADTQPFITYKPNPNTLDSVSGTVDMSSYLGWLKSNGYAINMTP